MKDKAFKRAVRDYMKRTGCSYSHARRMCLQVGHVESAEAKPERFTKEEQKIVMALIGRAIK